jgi:predicted RNA binding protein YcfA (HicA-like mRNA interferase family)
MGEKIRQFTARELERLLIRFGFILISQKGSHKKWRNLSTGRQVIVPSHSGRNIPLGTLRSILTSSQIPEEEWKG